MRTLLLSIFQLLLMQHWSQSVAYDGLELVEVDRFRSQFQYVSVGDDAEYVIEWNVNNTTGTCDGQISSLSFGTRGVTITKIASFVDVALKFPFVAGAMSESRQRFASKPDGELIVIVDLLENSFKEVARIEATEAIGFLHGGDLFLCEQNDQVVCNNLATGTSFVILEQTLVGSKVVCADNNSIIVFPAIPGQSGRLEKIVRMRNGEILTGSIQVLPGLGGQSGVTRANPENASSPKNVSSHAAIILAVTANRPLRQVVAIAAQFGAGPAIFYWEKEVLFDIVRRPNLAQWKLLEIVDNQVISIVRYLDDDTCRFECYSRDESGLHLASSDKLEFDISTATYFPNDDLIVTAHEQVLRFVRPQTSR